MNDNDAGSSNYGWGDFTCVSKEAKESYLLCILIEEFCKYKKTARQFHTGPRSIGEYNYGTSSDKVMFVKDNKIVLSFTKYKTPEEFIKNVTKYDLIYFGYDKIFETFDTLIDSFSNSYDGIDHQSLLNLPIDPKTGEVHHKFVKDLFQYILNNNFAILGGNDNSIEDHEYSSFNDGHFLINFLRLGKYDTYTVVYDDSAEDYVLQNKNKGSLVRLSFGNQEDTKKAKFPTLVDISITSFCDRGCKFCYQSSTTSGNHADVNIVKNILTELRNNNCLEVVFGGGEPTSHPDFSEIVEFANKLGFVVGVTTKNYNLLNYPDIQTVLSHINTLAISCNSISECKKAAHVFDGIEDFMISPEAYFQTVLGLNDTYELSELIQCVYDNSNYYSRNLNLLGYKDFGFGKNESPKDVSGWINVVKEINEIDKYRKLDIGVDSIVVKKYRQELLDAGVDYRNLVGEEGKFSCYIDCVKNTIAASSFTDTTFDFDSNWLQTFKSF